MKQIEKHLLYIFLSCFSLQSPLFTFHDSFKQISFPMLFSVRFRLTVHCGEFEKGKSTNLLHVSYAVTMKGGRKGGRDKLFVL
jgi:hypothetical protein